MKFKKPGIKKKQKRPKLKPPEEKHCRWCGETTDTECYRHCEVPYFKFRYGKGIGVKVDDNLTVWGCMKCDVKMSTKPYNATELELLKWEYEWLRGIIETNLV